ncbi:MAG: SusD/RagB family nutrient-binding outer membrane lipoprotein [Prevotellaceae bacterium]|nr:SusD/RagB family nutrient-binding outer membrane lipoprotein [Prevotellaceae bacterium]
MKRAYFILIALCCGLTSCQKFDEINENPNSPRETHPQLLLTQIEWDAFRSFQGREPLYVNKMLVKTDGESSGQYYKWTRGDFSFLDMRNVQKMMEEAERVEEPCYVALGKFFRAHYLYCMALQFGDIPYSEALKGESDGIYTPAYDDQKAVFAGVLQELEEANELLKGENTIIRGDIIYSGSTDQWRKLVNVFRLKILLSLSQKEADADLDVKSRFAAIVQSEPLMQGIQDNGQVVYVDQEGNRYPEFNSSDYGSGMYIDSTFIRRLQEHKDPRLFIFCTQTKDAKEAGKALNDFTAYEGGDPAAPYGMVNQKATEGKVSKVLERYYQDPTCEPSVLLGYSELQLMLAEAAVRGWISEDANAYYQNGVKASFKFYETYAKGLGQYVSEAAAEAYLSETVNDLSQKTTTTEKIEAIILQKYFQSFLQGKWTPFFDALRTGYPEYRRPAGVELPFRWMYPQSEYDYNAKNVTDAIKKQFGEGNDKINQKTWWLK